MVRKGEEMWENRGGMSDSASRELAELVVKKQMGEECGKVIKRLLRESDGLSLGRGSDRLNREALVKLIVHGLVEYRDRRYWSSADICCERLGHSRAILEIAEDIGEREAGVIEYLFIHGVAATTKLQELCGSIETLRKVVKAGLIAPVGDPEVIKEEEKEVEFFEDDDDDEEVNMDLEVPSAKRKKGTSRRKKMNDDDSEDEDNIEKKKWTLLDLDRFVVLGDDVLWRLEYPGLRRRRLKRLCIDFVYNKFNEHAAALSKKLFDLGAWRYSEKETRNMIDHSERVSYHHIPNGISQDILQKELNPKAALLMRYTRALACDQVKIIKYLPDNKVVFDATAVILELRKLALNAMITSRLGASAARIYALLSNKNNFIEQSEIAERALIPPREAREKLYQLWHDDLIEMNELAQSTAPKDPIFLWRNDQPRAVAAFLMDTRRAIRNCLIRLAFELTSFAADTGATSPLDFVSTNQQHAPSASPNPRIASAAHHTNGNNNTTQHHHNSSSSRLARSHRMTAVTDRLENAILYLHQAAALFHEPPTY